MKVDYEPREPQQSGVVSFASWDNPGLHDALRIAFNESPREQITRIEVTREGIKAYFETKNSCRKH